MIDKFLVSNTNFQEIISDTSAERVSTKSINIDDCILKPFCLRFSKFTKYIVK